MEDKLSIKINIADRFYPLKINRSEEEKIRKAAKSINEKIAEYKQHFDDMDAYDFLAMTTLQFATQIQEADHTDEIELINSEIQQLSNDITDYIKDFKRQKENV